MKPKLSVIVPIGPLVGRTENLFGWLKEIKHKPLDVILVLDDKMDGTSEIISKELVRLNNSNITFVSGVFGGPGATRNQAIPLVKSKWFTFWDADDIPNVDKFLIMIDEAANLGFKVAMGQFSVKDSRSNLTKYFTVMDSNNWDLTLAQTPGIWRFAFFYQEFQKLEFPALSMGEDQVYLAALSINKADVYETNEIVYEYFVGMNVQLTRTKSALIDIELASKLLLEISNGRSRGNQRLANFMYIKQQLTQIKKGVLKTALISLFVKLPLFLWAQPRHGMAMFLEVLIQKRKLGFPNQIFLQGGLGNQLFQISALKSFSGERPCQVISERNNFGRLPTLVEESLLATNFSSIESIEIERSLLKKKCLNLALRISAAYSVSDSPPKKAFLNISRAFIQKFYILFRSPHRLFISRGLGEDIKVSGNLEGRLLIGYFQSYQYAISIREEVRALVSKRIGNVQWLRQLRTEAQGTNPLVLQVRLGDYLQNPKFGSLDGNYFKQTLDWAGDSEELRELWLFSDDERLAIEMMGHYSEFHFQVVAPENSLDIDILCAMTLGQRFVISNSTFGWWGAFLSENAHQKDSVYFPRPWFRSIPSPLNLTPPNWNACPVIAS